MPVPPAGFYSSVVQLQPGDKLVGEFKARREGEQPAKEVRAAKGEKMRATYVDIVLYRHDVLAEGNEQSSNADWEIISINASINGPGVPLTVGTLMCNFFCEEGGTDTKMTSQEFVEALEVSRAYWRDKCLLAPQER